MKWRTEWRATDTNPDIKRYISTSIKKRIHYVRSHPFICILSQVWFFIELGYLLIPYATNKKNTIYFCPIFAHKNTYISFKYWISYVCFTIYYTDCLLYIFKFITLEMNWPNPFPQNTAIYVSFLTHMAAISFIYQPSYLENFFIPAGCLGWWRQYMHLLSAAAFAELSATFPKIVAAIFFFLLPAI